MNKLDLTDARPQVARDECANIAAVWLSAKTGAGIDLLRGALGEFAQAATPRIDTQANPSDTEFHGTA
jgi:GTP-binding protein HflX